MSVALQSLGHSADLTHTSLSSYYPKGYPDFPYKLCTKDDSCDNDWETP